VRAALALDWFVAAVTAVTCNRLSYMVEVVSIGGFPGFRLEQETTAGLEVDVECYALAGARWQERTRTAIAEAIIEEDSSIRNLVLAGELKLSVNLFTRSTLTSRPEIR
jgi:hypothetical protein